MARRRRISPAGITQHVIQRGNNRQACFASDDHRQFYLTLIEEYAPRYGIDVNGWVLMTNHVHLLVTPRQDDSLSEFMQAVGRRYVRIFNISQRRTGTLWEGRFKSCLVESSSYCLQCLKYIELNPVRANMVDTPADYRWSSYQCHVAGKKLKFHAPHSEYLALATNDARRQERYKAFVENDSDPMVLKAIRRTTNKELALGCDKFIRSLEVKHARQFRPGVVGRPKT